MLLKRRMSIDWLHCLAKAKIYFKWMTMFAAAIVKSLVKSKMNSIKIILKLYIKTHYSHYMFNLDIFYLFYNLRGNECLLVDKWPKKKDNIFPSQLL